MVRHLKYETPRSYPACFFFNNDNRITAIFPDLNNLSANGNTEPEAYAMAEKALDEYLETIEEKRAKPPEPSSLMEILPKLENIAKEIHLNVKGAFADNIRRYYYIRIWDFLYNLYFI